MKAVITAGVDIGSRTSKAVVLRGDAALSGVIGDSTTNPAATAEDIFARALVEAGVERTEVAYVVGTGYGRTQVPFADSNISEITCHGRGAFHLRPGARTIIDIGGQDTKVITVDSRGNLLDFAMNDKCAAGTGRFLEAMARTMDLGLGEMDACFQGNGEPCRITSMCSVFAESEVINLVNDGVPTSRIVKGLMASMAGRVASMVLRLGVTPELVMTGGVAKSAAVRAALQTRLAEPFADLGDADPQLAGALGAALIAGDFARGKER